MKIYFFYLFKFEKMKNKTIIKRYIRKKVIKYVQHPFSFNLYH